MAVVFEEGDAVGPRVRERPGGLHDRRAVPVDPAPDPLRQLLQGYAHDLLALPSVKGATGPLPGAERAIIARGAGKGQWEFGGRGRGAVQLSILLRQCAGEADRFFR